MATKVSAKERREMQAQMRELERASEDLYAMFMKCKPYLDETAIEKMPLPNYGPDHWGLLISELTRGNAFNEATLERWMLEAPSLFIPLVATLVRLGYAIREYDAA